MGGEPSIDMKVAKYIQFSPALPRHTEMETKVSTKRKKIIIAGASGLAGSAAMAHFANRSEWDVVAISRRPPLISVGNAVHLPIDLSDKNETAQALSPIRDVTHIAYAALNERSDDLIAGWSDPRQSAKNEAMLVNLVDPIIQNSDALEHIALVHGGKAYGVHIPDHKLKMPLREDSGRHPGENFYYRQHDYLIDKQKGARWSWTIFRTGAIWGTTVRANMNTLLALAILGVLRREAGLAMPVPAGQSGYVEPTDADLVAEAIEWAGHAPAARNEIFNITNGDVLAMHDLFEIVAAALDMEVSTPTTFNIKDEIRSLAPLWPAMTAKYNLKSPPDLYELLGSSLDVAQVLSEDFPPERFLRWGLLSTIKIRQAGFHACRSSPDSLRHYIKTYQDLGVIP